MTLARRGPELREARGLLPGVNGRRATMSEVPFDPEAFVAEALEPFGFVRWHANGLYEPAEAGDPDGVDVCLLAVVDRDDLIDIVAWRPSNPRRWWRRLG